MLCHDHMPHKVHLKKKKTIGLKVGSLSSIALQLTADGGYAHEYTGFNIYDQAHECTGCNISNPTIRAGLD